MSYKQWLNAVNVELTRRTRKGVGHWLDYPYRKDFKAGCAPSFTVATMLLDERHYPELPA